MPRQIGHVSLLGGAPNVVGQPQNILERVASWAWTSRPMTVSYVPSAKARPLAVPGRGLLVGVGDAQQRGLVERAPDVLQPDRQALAVEAAGDRDGRQPRHAGRD